MIIWHPNRCALIDAQARAELQRSRAHALDAYAEKLEAERDYWRNRALHKKHVPDPIMANPDARAVMRPRAEVVAGVKRRGSANG